MISPRDESMSRPPQQPAPAAGASAQSPAEDSRSNPASAETVPELEGYEIIRLLASGECTETWLAEDVSLFGRQVALKLIRPGLAGLERASALAALRSEAERLIGLRHPNVVQVFGWVESGEHTGLVLQPVAAASMADRLKRDGPIEWRAAARYVADVGEGLQAVHARDVIHRDVKPANILWDPQTDEAILTEIDVGARLAGASGSPGTFEHMAPEAFDGLVSPSVDVYGLAATLYTLITGRQPFPGPTAAEICRQAKNGLARPDPACGRVPEALEQIVRAGLAALPEHRPSLRDFTTRLRITLNHLLVDALPLIAGSRRGHPEIGAETPLAAEAAAPAEGPVVTPLHVHLIVKRQLGPASFVRVAVARPRSQAPAGRDQSKVPPAPDQVQLRGGDRARIEAVANRPGQFTVVSVDPAGNLDLLFPEQIAASALFASPLVPANDAVIVRDVDMTPPTGCERIVAIWSRKSLPLRLEQLQSVLKRPQAKPLLSRAYLATRDLKRVRQALEQLDRDECRAEILELDHAH